jgi:DNA-binding transcriptional regulator YdaS (Cro superfamily)
MKLSDYLKTTTQTEFAKQLGVTQGMVHQWVYGLRPISPRRCIAIEQLTNGHVTCEELRPDFDWRYLRNSKKTEA